MIAGMAACVTLENPAIKSAKLTSGVVRLAFSWFSPATTAQDPPELSVPEKYR